MNLKDEDAVSAVALVVDTGEDPVDGDAAPAPASLDGAGGD
jgi:hypothetical protein